MLKPIPNSVNAKMEPKTIDKEENARRARSVLCAGEMVGSGTCSALF